MARAMQSKPAEQDRLPVWYGFEKELPQKWLERIEELKRQGRAVEAEEMLSEFKRRFPEHPLPPGSK
jgi:antitoxin component of RelBE/YafQ-DinJ toxin-antitoxin module